METFHKPLLDRLTKELIDEIIEIGSPKTNLLGDDYNDLNLFELIYFDRLFDGSIPPYQEFIDSLCREKIKTLSWEEQRAFNEDYYDNEDQLREEDRLANNEEYLDYYQHPDNHVFWEEEYLTLRDYFFYACYDIYESYNSTEKLDRHIEERESWGC